MVIDAKSRRHAQVKHAQVSLPEQAEDNIVSLSTAKMQQREGLREESNSFRQSNGQ